MSYYRVLVDGHDIYDPRQKDMLLLNPVVRPSLDEAGGFDFAMDATQKYYYAITPFGSNIEVREDGRTIFFGRAMPPSINMYRQKTYHCEGAIAFLNDIIVPPLSKYVTEGFTSGDGGSSDGDDGFSSGGDDGGFSSGDDENGREVQRIIRMDEYIQYVFQTYNTFQTNSKREITLGTLDLEQNPKMPYDSDYKSCLDILREEILPYTGGYLVAEYSGGSITVSVKRNFDGANQPIRAGVNLLDFAEVQQGFYTAIMAKGGKPDGEWEDDTPPISTEEPITLGTGYTEKYGVICAYKYFPEATNITELNSRCYTFLASQQFAKVTLDVSAMDLHITNRAYDLLTVGSMVRFESPIPGETPIDMVVTNMEVHVDTGEKTVQLGERDRNKITQRWGSNKTVKQQENKKIKVENKVIEGNTNAVSSGGVYDAIQDTISEGLQDLGFGVVTTNFEHWVGTLEEYNALVSEGLVNNVTIYYIVGSEQQQ